MFQTFLLHTYLNNTGQAWLTAGLIFVAALIALKIFKVIIVGRLKILAQKTKNDFDDKALEIVANVKPPFYFLIALYVALRSLVLPALGLSIIKALFLMVIAYEVIKALQDIVEYVARKAMSRKGEEEENEATIKTLSVAVKIILWSVGLILVLDNLGVNISSLIAGLGIGGIAVALALQNVLGDIFASFSIIIDKPFQVGDFIKIGSDMGTVEKIGIKTTRIRTPDGQQLIVANKELTDARVQNFKRLEKRRALFDLGVIYETPKEKLEKIPKIIREIIVKIDKAEFDRCHFKEFGDFSLNFELAYYVETQDYKEYLDVVEKVNLEIFEAFGKQGIEFAYPTHVEYRKQF